ncbi:hypothetical protein AKJ38_01775 [candidate division MSBL1 archaeon SCGC-AAA259I14]|uniref:Uncharacterized protein n=1 Tax=candidate division MSBL1 archaeon SCGC-AAA259I14 TaxID=1698268 RepID=A0A133USL0_9EURY|nr:hypothetical protein AKJ38_01775 [candidate division MSBL1 archaeon SCGC-AAA259I14]
MTCGDETWARGVAMGDGSISRRPEKGPPPCRTGPDRPASPDRALSRRAVNAERWPVDGDR